MSGHRCPFAASEADSNQRNEPDFTFSIGRYKRPWVGTRREPEPGPRRGFYLRGTISAPTWAPGPPTRSPAFSSRG